MVHEWSAVKNSFSTYVWSKGDSCFCEFLYMPFYSFTICGKISINSLLSFWNNFDTPSLMNSNTVHWSRNLSKYPLISNHNIMYAQYSKLKCIRVQELAIFSLISQSFKCISFDHVHFLAKVILPKNFPFAFWILGGVGRLTRPTRTIFKIFLVEENF